MGKKSTGESRHVLEGDGLKELLRDDIQWEEATRNLLGLIEAKGNSSHRSPQLKPLSTHQPTLDTEDSSNLKDVGSAGKSDIKHTWEVGWEIFRKHWKEKKFD